MFDLVRNLKRKGYITAMLSNTEKPSVRHFEEQKYYDLFDPAVFSCVEGFRKPDPTIYKKLISVLKLRPEQIIFFDDKRENVDAAASLGIIAEQYTSFESLEKTLSQNNISFL